MYCLTLNSQLLINWNECLKTPKIWGLGKEVSVCKVFCYASITQFDPQSSHKTPGAFSVCFTTGPGVEAARSLARASSTSKAPQRLWETLTQKLKRDSDWGNHLRSGSCLQRHGVYPVTQPHPVTHIRNVYKRQDYLVLMRHFPCLFHVNKVNLERFS